MSNKLMSRKEVAAYVGVTHETIRNWERKGLIKPFCIINMRPRFKQDEVINMITQTGKKSTNGNDSN